LNCKLLAGQAYSLPFGGGKSYFRVVMEHQAYRQYLLFPLRILPPEDGVISLARWVTASGPRVHSSDLYAGLTEEESQPVQLRLPSCTEKTENCLSPAQRERYKAVKARLLKAAEPDGLLISVVHRTYNERLDTLAKTMGVDRVTLARELSTYFQVGLDIHKAALLQVFGGPRTKKKPAANPKKLGRTPIKVKTGHIEPGAPGSGINVTEGIAEQIRLFLLSEKDWFQTPRVVLFRRYRTAHIDRPVGYLADETPIFRPDATQDISQGQFNYHVGKVMSLRAREIAKVGRVHFANNKRILTGTARHSIRHPGQRYYIDATTADVYLVWAVNRKLLVGRPIIYVVIDAYSSLILAVHVTLETANGDQAKVALYRAMRPKDGMLATLGRSSLLAALPQGVVPQTISADRGEVLSDAGRSLAESLGVELQIAAPFMASWKSLVERYFKLQNEMVIHWMPGGLRQRMKERSDRDVRYDAALTLHGVQRVLLSLAAEWNLTHDMTDSASCGMLRGDVRVENSPLGFWRYGLEELHGSGRYLDRDDAVKQFLPTVAATLNRRGLQTLESLRFTADWMTEDDRFYELQGDPRAKLYLDPDTPFGAFFPDPDTGALREVKLVDTRGYDDHDVALEDIRMAEACVPLMHSDSEADRKTVVSTETAYRNSVVAAEVEATRSATKDDDRSKAEKVRSILDNRGAAKALGSAPTRHQGEGKASSGAQPVDDLGWSESLENFF
jgi:putative transposase